MFDENKEKEILTMRFEFKSLSTYEEVATPNFMGGVNYHSLIQEFDSMAEAVKYVTDHHGYLITDNGKFAFEVRNISLIK